MGGELRFYNGEEMKLPQAHSMDLQAAIKWMEDQGALIAQRIDKRPSLEDQAVLIQDAILTATKFSIDDRNAMHFLDLFHPNKTFAELRDLNAKLGYSGDALWKKMIDDAIKNTQRQTIGCFVAGTVVRIAGGNGSRAIEDVQVNDLVIAIPESGQGDFQRKSVLNTFVFENKPIWYVSFYDIREQAKWGGELADWFNVTSPLFVTPNHPFLVVGQCVGGEGHVQGSELKRGTPDNYVAYAAPIWKRVDQLVFNDVVFNPISNRLFAIALAKPVYQYDSEQPHLAWIHGYDQEEMGLGPNNSFMDGMLYDLSQHNGRGGFEQIEESVAYPIEADQDGEYYYDEPDERFTPYHTTVYNIEVADYHTYMVGGRGILVHNTNCGN
jgi:hypothetical protein